MGSNGHKEGMEAVDWGGSEGGVRTWHGKE